MTPRNQGLFDACVRAYATGETIKSFCDRTPRAKYDTARGWAMTKEFKSAVAAVQTEIYEVFIGKLSARMDKAADGIFALAENASTDSVRLAAWGRLVDDVFKIKSLVSLEQRIAQLEGRRNGKKPGQSA
jgi:hypothetical protein